MDDQDDFIRANEEAAQAITDLAHLLRQFHQGLVASGFDEDDAFDLTTEFLRGHQA